jgi:hypothetical protein
MKKMVKMSLVAASLVATAAMAADSGIDIQTSGQAVVYYNTAATNGTADQDLFGANAGDNTRANFGIQLNLNADLKNDFTFGSTINYLGTLGLEKNLVTNTMQDTGTELDDNNIADDIYLSQLYIAKKVGNTTVKLGRQELPQSLSPLAYSEGWNVFKNTFDAALVVNTDIPDTTLVGAYISATNGNGFGNDMASFDDLTVNSKSVFKDYDLDGTAENGGVSVAGEAYMLTAQNKSIPMATVTATYYTMNDIMLDTNEGADALWGDIAIADKELPVTIGLQGGSIMPEASALEDTTAFGAKVGMKPVDALSVCLAFSTVDDGTAQIRNLGGVKSPLYTQMIGNQDAIVWDNSTYMLKAAYNTGAYGTVIAQGTFSDDGSAAKRDLTDMELVYKAKVSGFDLMAAYIYQSWSEKDANEVDQQDVVRVVARYNF